MSYPEPIATLYLDYAELRAGFRRIQRLAMAGIESVRHSHDKLTDHQGVGLSTFYILNRINSLCRSSFTAVFLFLEVK